MANKSVLAQFIGGSERAVTVTNTVATQAASIATQTLQGGVNVITTLAANGFAALPVLPGGSLVIVTSTVATQTLTIFPPLGGFISAVGAAGTLNASVLMAAQGHAVFIATGEENGASYHRIV